MNRVTSGTLMDGVLIAAAMSLLTLDRGASAQARGDEAIALLARPGHHAMIRHALAPGSGDPSNFTLGECTTQRNLNDAGRRQAARLGQAIRVMGAAPTRILSSEWCRTLETAQLMDLGPVTPFEGLNSTWRRPNALVRERADFTRDALLALPQGETAILVTHASNIGALTGHQVSSGAGVVLRVAGGTLAVVGTFDAP